MEKDEILDTSIAIERRSGNITIFSVVEHPPCANKEFTVILPEIYDYTKSIQIASSLRQKGTPIGAIDILIAAICLNRNSALVTADGDFKLVKNAFPELQLRII